MVIGVGIDLVSIPRIELSIERWGARFLDRIYTPDELLFCLGRSNEKASLAARFAAKEACSKALGTGMRQGVTWRQIEVTHEPSGKPCLRLNGCALNRAKQIGVGSWHLSLTHEREYAGAVVVLEGGHQIDSENSSHHDPDSLIGK